MTHKIVGLILIAVSAVFWHSLLTGPKGDPNGVMPKLWQIFVLVILLFALPVAGAVLVAG